MKVLARHTDWAIGAKITESHDEDKSTEDQAYRRFTATIRGWRNWKIFEGFVTEDTAQMVQKKVMEIRDRIDSGDESVFNIKKGA